MQHKVNIDKECSFIEALRDDHYAPFGGVRNSRGETCVWLMTLLLYAKHHGEIHANKL